MNESMIHFFYNGFFDVGRFLLGILTHDSNFFYFTSIKSFQIDNLGVRLFRASGSLVLFSWSDGRAFSRNKMQGGFFGFALLCFGEAIYFVEVASHLFEGKPFMGKARRSMC